MRVASLTTLLIVCIVIFILVSVRKKLKLIGKVWLLVVLFIFFCLGGTTINSCVLPKIERQKIEKIADTLGDTYVKVEGDIIYVKINNEWVNLSKIKVVGSLTKDCTIEYDGKEIYLGHSGIVSALQVLQDMGFLKEGN